jgi:hypothetical protein
VRGRARVTQSSFGAVLGSLSCAVWDDARTGFDEYDRPTDEPPARHGRPRARASLTQEAEAIDCYEQRLAVGSNSAAALG